MSHSRDYQEDQEEVTLTLVGEAAREWERIKRETGLSSQEIITRSAKPFVLATLGVCGDPKNPGCTVMVVVPEDERDLERFQKMEGQNVTLVSEDGNRTECAVVYSMPVRRIKI